MTEYSRVCSIRRDVGRSIRALLDHLGDKWTLLVIAALADGPQRFTELRRGIPGISQRMLTLTVRNLERDGLVLRSVYAEVPPRVEYELTGLADSLLPHAVALADWAVEHEPEIQAKQAEYDEARAAASG